MDEHVADHLRGETDLVEPLMDGFSLVCCGATQLRRASSGSRCSRSSTSERFDRLH